MRFKLIITICPADRQQEIVDAAKKAGATGATLLSARGTGVKEAKTFFGLTLDKPQEAILMLVEGGICDTIMQTIYDAGEMRHPGNGISFAVDVDAVRGLESQMSVLKKEAEEGRP